MRGIGGVGHRIVGREPHNRFTDVDIGGSANDYDVLDDAAPVRRERPSIRMGRETVQDEVDARRRNHVAERDALDTTLGIRDALAAGRSHDAQLVGRWFGEEFRNGGSERLRHM